LAPKRRNPQAQEKTEKTNTKPLLHLKNDIVFKMIFGDEKNKHILKAFLLAVLSLPEDEYDVLQVTESYNLRVDHPDEKLGILDVYIRTKAGKHIDLEIQVARTPFLKERIAGYTGKMLGAQLPVGGEYTEMKKVIAIVILDYNLIEDSENFHNRYLLYDGETKSLFTDILEIHTLEMRKLQKDLGDMPEADEKTKQQTWWLKFIGTEKEEEIKVLATKVPEINDAYEILQKLSEDESVRLRYESREKAIIDEQARIYVATKEGEARGRAEGEAKGRAEGKRENALETARRLLAMGLGVEIAAQGSGLTEEEVRDL
jgi:predicted transposase/invertase (TIGR01784 family)